MKYGLQLYSIRDMAEENFEKTLKTVAEMGYEMVESAGFFGLPAEEVKAMLDHYGLTLCSTHTGYREVFSKFEETFEYHKKVGCPNMILPGVMFSTKEEIDYTVACINRYQPILEAEGMSLHFHNHYKEFLPNKDGLITQDEFAKRTRVLFEIDTFWAFNAGKDPLALMDQYKDRIKFIHLKDGFAGDPAKGGSGAVGKSLGLGEAPVAAVRQKAIEMGITMVVESEDLDPTGEEEVKRCIDYLRSLEA
ncbi:MAG: sugar phosphate isomerase/epimerase [Clostridia bacterium]|nr:sugar phosphate isomerase/epimerase [Clostridia bacterium]